MSLASIIGSIVISAAITLFSALDPISFEYPNVSDEKGSVYLILHAEQALNNGQVEISGDDGSSIKRNISIQAGARKKLTWKQLRPNVHYTVKVRSSELESDFGFDVRRAAASGKVGIFNVLSSAEDIVVFHRIRYKTSFALTKYTLSVFNVDGTKIVEQVIDDKPVAAGSSLDFSWDHDDDVFMIVLKGEDDVGRFAEHKVVPWSIDIPHTDATFETDKFDIRKEQEYKLDESFAVIVHELDRLERANQAVNGNIVAQLYIVGYTDTVGDRAKNQVLSEKRARAIAEYFSKKGTWCEIWFGGMGESGLAVQTGDSVDLEANRRASYILGVDKPQGAKLPNTSHWKKFASARPRQLDGEPALPKSYREYVQNLRSERIKQRGGPARSGGGGESNSSSAEDGQTEGSLDERKRISFDQGDSQESSYEALVGEEGGGPSSHGKKPGASGKACAISGQSSGGLEFGAIAWILLVIRGRRSHF